METEAPVPSPDAGSDSAEERLHAAWLEWTHDTLGSDPVRAEAAATAAGAAITAGSGINAAYEAARLAWGPSESSLAAAPVLEGAATLKDRLAAWQAAGVIDAATAGRIAMFEADRPIADRAPGISVSEVVAYMGTVVLLVGVAFLYGTKYDALGSGGRLSVLALVVGAGLAAGELARRIGPTGTARRARAAGWTVTAFAGAVWFMQAFVDSHVLTQPANDAYPGASPDTSGSIMLGAAIGAVIATVLLWRAGAGLVAFATSVLGYTTAAAMDAYARNATSNTVELTWVVPAVILAILSETITRGHERRWAREVLRFMAVLPPAITALVLSFSSDGGDLESFAGLLAFAAFGLALLRGSAGYAIAAGVALFIVVNEVGFRHFAESLGFPVVLIVSGITLFAVAGGLVRWLPSLRRSGSS